MVDVRVMPKSRHSPQFNRPVLSRSLHAVKIGYRHLKVLGGLRHAQPVRINLGWRNVSFRGFADYMQTRSFQPNADVVARFIVRIAGAYQTKFELMRDMALNLSGPIDSK